MKFGIIGGGPSGLAMGMFLKFPHQILEKNNHPGGHTGSFKDKGYTFDQGPHIMFSKNKEALTFMIKSLGKNIHTSKRNNKVYFKNRLIKYPFENDLKSLPIEDNFECLKTYLLNPYKKKYKNPKNLKQWLLFHFGSGICEKYLFPYNEKVWNLPVEELSMLWADRIPNPPADDIIRSAIGDETEGYLHQLYYHYPLKGGYQSISEAWAKKVNIRYDFKVKKITKTKKNTFLVTDGRETLEFDQLISTMPIHELIKIVDLKVPQKVRAAIRDLIANPIIAVSLGIKGKDTEQFTAVYFPEKEFLVNRISFPKTFSPYNAPKNHYSIQAEITCKKNSSLWKKSDKYFLNHVKKGLIKKGFIKRKTDVVYERVARHEYAYVVYDTAYQKNVSLIRKWFPEQGIRLAGRFSYFEYINVDAALVRASEIASSLNKRKVKLLWR